MNANLSINVGIGLYFIDKEFRIFLIDDVEELKGIVEQLWAESLGLT